MSIFHLTSPLTSIRLNQADQGEVSYTASNAAGRSLRARAVVVPLGATQGDWLSIVGDADRRFEPDGTEQFTVCVAVPAGTPVGEYRFRLDVVSEENPDEDFAEGPVVAAHVEAAEVTKKAFPWWIPAAVLGVLALVALIVVLTLDRGPKVTLSASPTTVAMGGSSVITWATSDADKCTASGGWTGDLAGEGSKTIEGLNTSREFKLTCTNEHGSGEGSVTVDVKGLPSVSLEADRTSIAIGDEVEISWTTTDADSCTASGDWSGELAGSGSKMSGALSQSSEFTLRCENAVGNNADTLRVNVISQPIVTLSADRTSVREGESATLTWSASDADQCTASGDWSGSLPGAGSRTIENLTKSSDFRLTCRNALGTQSDNVQVAVTPPTCRERTIPVTLDLATDRSNARIERGDAEIDSDDWTSVGLSYVANVRERDIELTVSWYAQEGNHDKSNGDTRFLSSKTFKVFTVQGSCPDSRIVATPGLVRTTSKVKWYRGRAHGFRGFDDTGSLKNISVRFDGNGGNDDALQAMNAVLKDFSVRQSVSW